MFVKMSLSVVQNYSYIFMLNNLSYIIDVLLKKRFVRIVGDNHFISRVPCIVILLKKFHPCTLAIIMCGKAVFSGFDRSRSRNSITHLFSLRCFLQFFWDTPGRDTGMKSCKRTQKRQSSGYIESDSEMCSGVQIQRDVRLHISGLVAFMRSPSNLRIFSDVFASFANGKKLRQKRRSLPLT